VEDWVVLCLLVLCMLVASDSVWQAAKWLTWRVCVVCVFLCADEATDVTVNLKDFKAMLSLCENLGTHIKLCFDSPGNPLVAEPHFPHAHGQVRLGREEEAPNCSNCWLHCGSLTIMLRCAMPCCDIRCISIFCACDAAAGDHCMCPSL
jgi:hypothetical protein